MAKEKPADTPPAKTDATRATPAQAVELLRAESGAAVEAAWIESDIKAGAPVNGDGSVNLIVYAAWLLKQGEGLR